MLTATRATAWLRAFLVNLVLPALVAIVAWRTFHHARVGSHFGATIGDSEIQLHDFASHLTFAKELWRGGGGYGVAAHLRVTERLAGRALPYALPFGYSPTMLWVLAPFCALPTAWGFLAWTLLGLVGARWICGRYPSLVVAMVFISPVALGCWALGQTAVLTAVALLYLMCWEVTSARTGVGPRDLKWVAAIVWALTAKPPLAIVAVTALLGGRRLAIVAVTVAIATASTALLLPIFGKTGLLEYVGLLGRYDLDTAAPAFAWSLRPDSMANLRALLHVTLGVGDGVASRWSAVLWLLSSASIVVAAARRAVTTELRWSLAVLAYLLFCPHVSWTEALNLVVAVAALEAAPRVPVSIRGAGIALVLALIFVLPTMAFGDARVAAGFIGELSLAGILMAAAWRSPAGTARRTERPSTT